MNPKHDEQIHNDRRARAPYNFVPLPDRPVLAGERLPDHDKYDTALKSGRIVCTLTTLSPLYTRTALTPDDYEKVMTQMQEVSGEEKGVLTDELRDIYAQFFHQMDAEQPSIPGSSLRGMVRTLVEIAGHGYMRSVGDKPTFTFRAVAAARDDPLRSPYEQAIGRFGSEIKAGYLARSGDRWAIAPATTPDEKGLPERRLAYLKVKESAIRTSAISGFQRLNSSTYTPGWYPVSFNIQTGRNRFGAYPMISQIGDESAGYQYKGVLVCSGNMLETGKTGQTTPRRNHALVLERDPHHRLTPIPIPNQVVEDYLAGLTPFQRNLDAWGGKDWGCLKEGAPIFYVEGANGQVAYFGHSPNFRVPMQLAGTGRAATPADFVPSELVDGTQPDLAEAIFGWVDKKRGERAGRVFFGDAQFQSARDGLWLRSRPIPLHVLGSPKSTTFQHYLVQDGGRGHNPNNRATLAHYGTSPTETQIRGYKQYWHRGNSRDIEASTQELQHPRQLTYVRPVKAGVTFQFDIRFENLRDEELGALLWALTLPGNPEKRYAHKLGMGKPLGMGSVEINAQPIVDDRSSRYARLFTHNQWHTPESEGDSGFYVAAFEQYVLQQLGYQSQRLTDVQRIQMLLALLEWREADPAWLEQTRYLEIEHERNGNEYKPRPVLPDPLVVVRSTVVQRGQHPMSTQNEPVPLAANEKRGTVTKFGLGDNRSFGFIRPDGGGNDIFVHRSQLAATGGTLKENQRVRFKTRPGMKGREEAYDVHFDQ